MKRLFLAAVAAVAVMASGLNAGAQVKFGVLGGFTSSSTKASDIKTESVSLYHAGVAARVALPYDFAIQPQLVYQVKGTAVDGTVDFNMKTGYVELPVQLQWGPDLMVCRPYVLAEPFVGYAVNAKSVTSVAPIEYVVNDIKNMNLNRFEYGLGVGAGIEFWRLQLSAKYFWNFGPLTEKEKNLFDNLGDSIKESVTDSRSFNGISVSLALFF